MTDLVKIVEESFRIGVETGSNIVSGKETDEATIKRELEKGKRKAFYKAAGIVASGLRKEIRDGLEAGGMWKL